MEERVGAEQPRAARQRRLQARTLAATRARLLPAPTGQEQGRWETRHRHPQNGFARRMGLLLKGAGTLQG